MLNDAHVRLREARESAGYRSAADFARRNALPEVTYRSHENGTRGISTQTARKYASLLNVSPAWLLTGEGETTATGQAHHAVINHYIDTALGGEADAMAARHTYAMSFVPPRTHFHQTFFGAVVEGDELPQFPHGSELIFAKTGSTLSDADGKYVLCEEQGKDGKRRFFGRLSVDAQGDIRIDFPAQSAAHRRTVTYRGSQAAQGLAERRAGSLANTMKNKGIPTEVGNVRIVGVLVKSMRNE